MKDCWGECCPNCEYMGHSYKPCRVCDGERGGARVPKAETIVTFSENGRQALILEKWDENNWLVIPIKKFSCVEDLTNTDLHIGEYVLQGGLTHTLTTKTLHEKAKFSYRVLPRFVNEAQTFKRYSLTREGLTEDQKTRIGKPIMSKNDPRIEIQDKDYNDWARIFVPDHESQL